MNIQQKTEPQKKQSVDHDPVNHPSHYTSHPSGVECIRITEHFNFNLGNAIKYVWRAGAKGNQREDISKSIWYLNRELQRIAAEETRATIGE